MGKTGKLIKETSPLNLGGSKLKKEFGNRKNFSVQIELVESDTHILGDVFIWLKNRKLGDSGNCGLINSVIYLARFAGEYSDQSLVESLDTAFKSKKGFIEIVQRPSISTFFLLDLGDVFDNYSIYTVNSGEEIRFVWYKHSDYYESESESEKLNQINYESIPRKYYISILDEVETYLKKLTNKKNECQ